MVERSPRDITASKASGCTWDEGMLPIARSLPERLTVGRSVLNFDVICGAIRIGGDWN